MTGQRSLPNTSDHPLFAIVKLRNPTTNLEKAFRIDLAGGGAAELGHKEGWVLASGDTFELVNETYRTWTGSVP